MSLITEFYNVATRTPDAPAVQEEGRTITYRELAQLIDQLAAGLLRSGVMPGERLALHLGNRLELVALYYACQRVGAVIVPLHQRLVTGEINHLLSHSGARYYVGDQQAHDRYASVIDTSAMLDRAWIVDRDDSSGKRLPWSTLLGETGKEEVPNGHPDWLAAIFYTSGTTGTPKAIVHSQASLELAVGLMEATMPPRTAEGTQKTGAVHSTLDIIVPWSILMTLAAHRLGRAVVLLPALSTEATLALLQRQPLSFLKGTPSHFKNLLEAAPSAEQPHHSVLRETYCVTGGDFCPPPLAEAWRARWACSLRSSYGMTESGGPIFCHPDADATAQPSIGWPLPGVIAQQSDTGELLVRSPANILGWWNGQSTDRLPPDRWISTGDLVQRQDDGSYLFLGREKDLLKSEAYPISPHEVEQALLKLPAIAEAVVFGIPDSITGQRAVAMLRTSIGQEISEKALKEHLIDLIAEYKHPRQYLFVERIPVTSAGKLSRKQLANDYLQSLATDNPH